MDPTGSSVTLWIHLHIYGRSLLQTTRLISLAITNNEFEWDCTVVESMNNVKRFSISLNCKRDSTKLFVHSRLKICVALGRFQDQRAQVSCFASENMALTRSCRCLPDINTLVLHKVQTSISLINLSYVLSDSSSYNILELVYLQKECYRSR